MAWNYPKVGGLPTLDPDVLAEAAERLNTQTDFIGRANSISCPVGIYPGSAWFVVPRSVVDGDGSLDRNTRIDIAWKHTLSDSYDESGATTTTFKGYVVHEATCVALDGDSKGAYLLEMRDVRQLLLASNSNKLYNVSHNENGTKKYFDSTTYAPNVPWTWQQILNDLWNDLPTVAGAVPTLPFSPAFTPDTIRVVGGSTWEAIGEILDFCQAILCYDPTADTFSLQRLGTTQAGLVAAQAALTGQLILDYLPKPDCGIGNIPEKLSFTFPRRTAGQPKQGDSAYVKDIPTGIAGAQAGTKLSIPMPLIAEYKLLTDTTPTNQGACDAAASEMADKMIVRMSRLLVKRDQRYASLVTTILPGCDVHFEQWTATNNADALRTEIASLDNLLLPNGIVVDPWRWPTSKYVIAKLCGDLVADCCSGASSSSSSNPSGFPCDGSDSATSVSVIPGSGYDPANGNAVDLTGMTLINTALNKAGSHNDEVHFRWDAKRNAYFVADVKMHCVRPVDRIKEIFDDNAPADTDGDSDHSKLAVTGARFPVYLADADRPNKYCAFLEADKCTPTNDDGDGFDMTADPSDVDCCGQPSLPSSHDCSSSSSG